MNDNKIRHLPVVEGNRLVGVLSIRDLIVQKLHRVKTTAEFLQQQVQLQEKLHAFLVISRAGESNQHTAPEDQNTGCSLHTGASTASRTAN